MWTFFKPLVDTEMRNVSRAAFDDENEKNGLLVARVGVII